ncbi:MAG: glycoside hydrolase family 5 protein [Ruminococcus sp.]|nr:glycoside hydrolase family 5 protein [Ruminococcus sp.]
MKLKKMIAVLMAAVTCAAFMTACSSSDDSSESDSAESATESVEDEVNMEIRDISSWELVQEMTIGWNLGNTMDATGSNGLDNETTWQSVKTSKEMVDLLVETGFNVFRVPVSWGDHMDEDYNVDEEWMARVKEIVDYGIDNGMFVILNTHHEEWYFPTEENKEQDIEQLTALWSQIAEEFKGYDEHLIFEGLNEPRCRETAIEWTGGDEESRAIVAEYEQAFYETVRNSGGNNAKRHLMLTGYAASSTRTCLEEVWLPEDDDKVIVSVHAYLPYSLALDTTGTDEWDENNTSEIDNLFINLEDLFLQYEIPVIIGEFGTVNKDNLEDRIACAEYYVSKGTEYGVPMIWWDNNSRVGSGENFALMDRSLPQEWYFPELVEALIESAPKVTS